MAKRFTDSRKWDDEWFSELSCKYKFFWIYMLDKCDHAGFFKPNLRLAKFHLDQDYSHQTLLDVFKGKIEVVDSKWFIEGYIKFQYGELNEDTKNPCHRSAIELLKKHGVYDRASIGLHSPKVAYKREIMNKGKDMGKDNIKVSKKSFAEFVTLTDKEHESLLKSYGEKPLKDMITRLNDYKGSTGKRYKNDYYTVRNWFRREETKGRADGKRITDKNKFDGIETVM